jgi:hypothetical protein
MTAGDAWTVGRALPRRGRHVRMEVRWGVALPADRPAPRVVGSGEDAVAAVAEWMHYFSFGDTLAPSSFHGVVYAERGIARVHTGSRTVTLRGARHMWKPAAALGRYVMIFSTSGFSPGARGWANRRRVALFVLSDDGMPEPVGAVARRLLAGADANPPSVRG